MDYSGKSGGVLRCETPPHAACEPAGSPPGVAVVSISLNAQQWTHNNLTFEYYAPPVVETFSPAAGFQQGGVLVQLVGRHFRPPLAADTTSAGALPALGCRFGTVVVQGTVGSHEPVLATLATHLYVPSPVPDENGTVCSHAPGAGTHAAPCAVWCYSPARTVGTVPIEITFNGQAPLVISPIPPSSPIHPPPIYTHAIYTMYIPGGSHKTTHIYMPSYICLYVCMCA